MNAIGVPVETIPAWLYFVGPMVTLMMGGLATTVIGHYRKVQTGKLWPEATVIRMQAQFELQITNDRATYEIQLAAARRDSDDWRGAYHLLAESAKISEDRMDEVLETTRLAYGIIRALPQPSGGST